MGTKGQHKHFAGFDLNRRSRGVSSLNDGLSSWLTAKGLSPEQVLLGSLWKNWESVMGSLAVTAHPLGHRKNILLIGADDPCVMQELTYVVPEILERANTFMNSNFFSRVELHLLMGKNTLQRTDISRQSAPPQPPRPRQLGDLKLPADSPLRECYNAYVRMFKKDIEK